MSAPFSAQPSRSKTRQRRMTVTVQGKVYQGVRYAPQFGLGILCRDEQDQARLHARLLRLLPGRQLKVLVI